MPSDDLLADLHQRLESLADIADKLRTAIAIEDEEAVSKLLDMSRTQHAALGEANARMAELPPSEEGLAKMRQMWDFMQRVRLGDDAAKAWMERPMPPESDLLRSKEGIRRLADNLLPHAWDKEHDILLLVGKGSVPLCTELLARGQKRVLVYFPVGCTTDSDELPADVVVVQSAVELRNAAMSFPGDVPRHFTTKVMPDEQVNQDHVKEAVEMAGEALNALTTRRTPWIRLARSGRCRAFRTCLGSPAGPRSTRWRMRSSASRSSSSRPARRWRKTFTFSHSSRGRRFCAPSPTPLRRCRRPASCRT